MSQGYRPPKSTWWDKVQSFATGLLILAIVIAAILVFLAIERNASEHKEACISAEINAMRERFDGQMPYDQMRERAEEECTLQRP